MVEEKESIRVTYTKELESILKDLEDDNNDLSDYVLARLAQAREKAVEMARSKTSTT